MTHKELVRNKFCRDWGKDNLGNTENEYLTKYLLSDLEFNEIWKSLMYSIFANPIVFPQSVFLSDFDYKILNGGVLFVEEEFTLLKKCLEKTKDQWLFIIEEIDSPIEEIDSPNDERLLWKFPVGISWNELMNGGMLSFEVFGRPIRNYIVFGDSGLWGKYVGSDYIEPKDILGFKHAVADVFDYYFNNYEEID